MYQDSLFANILYNFAEKWIRSFVLGKHYSQSLWWISDIYIHWEGKWRENLNSENPQE